VSSRTSYAEKLIRSSLRGRNQSSGVRAAPAQEFDEVTVTRRADCAHRPAGPKLESELGEATYNCTCGFTWQAPVLTSVDCPHCGDSQAW
jgi:hypothetical protein